MWILRLSFYFFLLVHVCGMCVNQSTSDCTKIQLIGVTNNSSVSTEEFSILDKQKKHNGDLEKVSEVAISSQQRSKRKKQSLFQRILPMFIMPYLVQSAMLPMILMSLKVMLLNSMFIGKLALILVAINALRARSSVAGDYNTKEDNTQVIRQHYGYSGNEEYGAWVN